MMNTYDESLELWFYSVNRIPNAIEKTKEILPDYWKNTLLQRIDGETTCGSFYPGVHFIEELERILIDSSWGHYDAPNLMEGCTAFVAKNVGGVLGIVNLSLLPADHPVVLDDRKNTGNVSATVKRSSDSYGEFVDFTVIILGMEQGEEVVFTFHPGDPVQASRVKTELGYHGKVVTAKEAMALGLSTAKVV